MSSTETPIPDDTDKDHHHSGISGWGIFLIILFVVLILAAIGYVLLTRYRAHKLGLPPPSLNPFARNRDQSSSYRAPAPAPGGVQGWIADKWSSLRNGRLGGGYESTTNFGNGTRGQAGGGGGAGQQGGRRGFGPLDPDEAWDARVDHEAGAYYEEQELGLQDPHGPYVGGGYGEVGVGGIEEGRGRSRSRQRELDARYDEEMHSGGGGGGRGAAARNNPFGDAAEPSNISLRSISPRPDGDRQAGGGHRKGQPSLGVSVDDHSPTESRRSVFREDM